MFLSVLRKKLTICFPRLSAALELATTPKTNKAINKKSNIVVILSQGLATRNRKNQLLGVAFDLTNAMREHGL
jgi:hypothetical protein